MKTLDEIKYEYAKELLYNDWMDFEENGIYENNLDEIAERYAKEKVNESLDLAAENVQMKVHDGHNKTDSYSKHVQIGVNNIQVYKESILKLKQ